MSNRLFEPSRLDVPHEAMHTPASHDHGLTQSAVNVKWYPSAPADSTHSPNSQITWRITPGDLFLDPSSLTFHCVVAGDGYGVTASLMQTIDQAHAMVKEISVSFNGQQQVEATQYANWIESMQTVLGNNPTKNYVTDGSLPFDLADYDKIEAGMRAGFFKTDSTRDTTPMNHLCDTYKRVTVGATANTSNSKHRLSFKLNSLGVLRLRKWLWGNAIGTFDITLTLNNNFEPVYVYDSATSALATGLAAGTGKTGWKMYEPYITGRLIKMAPSYVSDYRDTLNSDDGLQIEFDSYRVLQETNEVSAGNVKNFFWRTSLSNVNNILFFWKRIALVSNMDTAAGHLGIEERHFNKSEHFADPGIDAYQVLINGLPAHSQDIACSAQDYTEAIYELSKVVGVEHDQQFRSKFRPELYKSVTALGVPHYKLLDVIGQRSHFFIGQNVEKSSLRSGQQVKDFSLRVKYNGSLTADQVIPTKAAIPCFYAVLHHDQKIVLKTGRRFAIYQ